MRHFINIVLTESVSDRENDQDYLMAFYNSCMFIANKYRGFAFGAAVFSALAKNGKVDRLEDMFNNELLPFLKARGYPDQNSPEWGAAQDDVMHYFHEKKRGDYDISDLKEEALVEGEVLEEGVRDQIEAVVDRVLKLFSPKHVTYEAACGAIDNIERLTGGKGYISYTKDELLMGGKLVKEVAATVVGASLALNQIAALGMPITAGIVATAASIVGAGVMRNTSGRRSLVVSQDERHTAEQQRRAAYRSPAPMQ